MKRWLKLFAFFTCLVLIFTALPLATPANAEEETIEDLYKKLKDLSSQQKEWDAMIDAAEEDIQAETQKIEYLNVQISLLEDKISVLNQIIEDLEYDISVLEAKLLRSEDELTEYYKIYYGRVRANYEAGQTSYLEVLLGAGSFSDYLTRLDVAEQIMQYDNNLIDAMGNKIAEIDANKTEVEATKAENQTAKDSLAAEQESLKSARAQSDALVTQLGSEIDDYEAKKDEAEAAKEELNKRLDELIKAQTGLVDGAFMWPVPGSTIITSPFGYRSDPFTGATKWHSGIDIGTRMGTDLHAANGGTVVGVSYEYSGGYYIVIDHGGGYSSRYFHLSAQYVTVGETVSRGEVIGKTGMSGAAVTGPHLHFEMRIKNFDTGVTQAVNPLLYVSPY